MSIETQLREALAARADEVSPAVDDPWSKVDGAILSFNVQATSSGYQVAPGSLTTINAIKSITNFNDDKLLAYWCHKKDKLTEHCNAHSFNRIGVAVLGEDVVTQVDGGPVLVG